MTRNLPATTTGPLSSKARWAADVAGGHSATADERRRLHPEVAQALTASGFPAHFVPTRWGGRAGTFTELLGATALVGEACASAAWCAGLAAGASRMAAFLPEQAQADLWADGPDVPIACALNPAGRAEPVPGGWRLTGAWPYASGAAFADWALLYTLTHTDGVERGLFFAVPRADFTVLPTWRTVGMRGTGSDTIELAGAFVPAHRALDKDDLLAGRAVGSDARCHTVPHVAVTGLLFAAPALGAARGVLRRWTHLMAGKTGGGGKPARDRAAIQLALTRATAEIDAATMFLDRVAAISDAPTIDTLHEVRNGTDCALAVDYLAAAVDRLFAAAGTTGQSESAGVERAWRDVRTIAGHAAMQVDVMAARYASVVLAPPG